MKRAAPPPQREGPLETLAVAGAGARSLTSCGPTEALPARRATPQRRRASTLTTAPKLQVSTRRSIAMVAACPFPTHQGTQVFVRHLVNALAAAGHHIHLFTYDEGEPLKQADVDPRVVWHRVSGTAVGLRSGPSAARVLADARLTRAVLEVLRRERFDLLHVHNAEGLAIGAAVARLTRTPLVYHAHSSLGLELPLYARSPVARLAAKAVGSCFDYTVPRLADAVICFDEAQRLHHIALGVAPVRTHVVPLGLALNELHRPLAKRSSSIIAYAGNPDSYQNLHLIRGAFALLHAANPTLRLRLISNHASETFGDLAHDPGVELRRFSGPGELAQLLGQASLGVVARTLWVGAPVKALSYISAGLPIVAVRSGATGLLAGHPEAAVLTDATAESLAAGITRVLAAPTSFDSAKARAALAIENHIAAYEATYASVLRHCE